MFRACARRFQTGPNGTGGQAPGRKPRRDMGQWEIAARQFAADFLNDNLLGYTARVVFFGGLLFVGGGIGYNAWTISEEQKPIAKRWVPRYTQISFIERIQEPGTNMWIYRFALPNTWDYAGYEPVQSVELMWDNSMVYNTRRFLTPISHPEQRGIIEFGVKHHIPGDMSYKLQKLRPGEKVFMGRWIKEFRYKANQHDEIGYIGANSGITPLLQILTANLHNKDDKTKFKVLFANAKPEAIPFKQKLDQIQKRFPEKLNVTYVCNVGARAEEVTLHRATRVQKAYGKPQSNPGMMQTMLRGETGSSIMLYDDSNPDFAVKGLRSTTPGYEGFVGYINKDLIMETMPTPNQPNSKILICLPGQLMAEVCGRSYVMARETYYQGLYRGIMREIGYPRDQLYKFGYSIQGQALNS